jgi:B-box zinc finger
MNCTNHPDRERIAFCQNCGKPLCQECTRTVGSAVFCEPCLAARLGTTVPPAGAGSYAYTDPATGIHVNGTIPPPPPPGSPNPWLAAGLGFIPGVGAMYNEQYAKGIIHLVVFAVLISLADNHGIFGLFIAGWICYMAIEAYHTAAARRDGRPLPNPFGLNDIGERLGFGKAWSSGHRPAAYTPSNPYAAASGAPPEATAQSYPPPSYPPPSAGFVPPTQPWGAPQQAGYQSAYYAPPVPPIPFDESLAHPGSRFPVGAIWLIVLGALFLIANAGIFHGFSGRLFVPLLLIGLAVWVFITRMTSYGSPYSEYGAPGYQLRLFRAAAGAAWLGLVGLLFLLDDFGILSWGHSWPLFIILAGVMAVFKRAAYSAVAAAPYNPQYPFSAPPTPPAPPAPAESAATSIVPHTTDETDLRSHNHTDDQEGR